ncbi:MAG: AbrB/MazE/SpoVT family DNA-binding domain-containing protein [Candidatus Diapherotrites archaeon]
MYESISVVGERGQITIPKLIRKLNGLKAKDKVIVKIEDSRIVIEKALNKKQKEELMREYYTKYSKENEELSEEMISASSEVV